MHTRSSTLEKSLWAYSQDLLDLGGLDMAYVSGAVHSKSRPGTTPSWRIFQDAIWTPKASELQYIPRPPNVPLLRALWSLVDGICGVSKGSWGVLDMDVDGCSTTC